MSIISIILFCISLIICLILKINVVFAIAFGFIDFFIYALLKGYKFKKVSKMCLDGFLTCKNVYITFSMISMLTGLWRCSGTIPSAIYYLLSIVNYKYFLLITFLFCSLISMLFGSLIATATTMGVICMTIARSLGLNEVMIMGAILSGVIVGDRMSPVSTSCLLVATMTKTDMYDNIKNMFKTTIVPYIVTCILFLLLGHNQNIDEAISLEVLDTLRTNFNINIISLIPIFAIILLSIFRVDIKLNVLISMFISIFVGFFNEHAAFSDMISSLIYGYKSTNLDVARIIYGGGLISVLNVVVLVGISASFSGIIKNTDLIEIFNKITSKVMKKTNEYVAVVIFSIIYSVIGCNQSVPVILISETMGENIKDKKLFALMIENSTIVIPMIIPWNTACTACLLPMNGQKISVFFAFYIYAVVLYSLIIFRNINKNMIK